MPSNHSFCVFVTRLFVVALGATAIGWGVLVFPIFWQHAPLERVAKRILSGQPYKQEALLALLPAVQRIEEEEYCRSSALAAATLIRLRILEELMASGDRQLMEGQLSTLSVSIQRSLLCSPANPFLWMVLYWVDMTQNGFGSNQMKLLRLSYQLGPNEGWIGIKRSPLAFNVFESLPPDLAEATISEFLGLLNSAFFRQTAEIFAGPAWRVKDRILARLNEVRPSNRQIFARLLFEDGFAIEIPGVIQRDQRPWRR